MSDKCKRCGACKECGAITPYVQPPRPWPWFQPYPYWSVQPPYYVGTPILQTTWTTADNINTTPPQQNFC